MFIYGDNGKLQKSKFGLYPLDLTISKVKGGWDDKWEDSIEYTEGVLEGNQDTIEGDPHDIEETYDARLLASMVSYSFGAGYQVNDSISIDLLHFAKLTDLSTWFFSVTIGFGAPPTE